MRKFRRKSEVVRVAVHIVHVLLRVIARRQCSGPVNFSVTDLPRRRVTLKPCPTRSARVLTCCLLSIIAGRIYPPMKYTKLRELYDRFARFLSHILSFPFISRPLFEVILVAGTDLAGADDFRIRQIDVHAL